jgi:hypothetical protein
MARPRMKPGSDPTQTREEAELEEKKKLLPTPTVEPASNPPPLDTNEAEPEDTNNTTPVEVKDAPEFDTVAERKKLVLHNGQLSTVQTGFDGKPAYFAVYAIGGALKRMLAYGVRDVLYPAQLRSTIANATSRHYYSVVEIQQAIEKEYDISPSLYADENNDVPFGPNAQRPTSDSSEASDTEQGPNQGDTAPADMVEPQPGDTAPAEVVDTEQGPNQGDTAPADMVEPQPGDTAPAEVVDHEKELEDPYRQALAMLLNLPGSQILVVRKMLVMPQQKWNKVIWPQQEW